MKKLNHLSEIFTFYDAYIVDLWGVIHNGIRLNSGAIEVLDNLSKNNKKITLLSNAPRPNKVTINFLRGLKMNEKYLDYVLTSGEAALKSLRNNKFGKKFFHLGTERDESLFYGLEKNKTDLEKSDFILCSGLFDEHDDLKYYENLLKKYTSKKLICTNPDLIVHRGSEEYLCAGSIAEVFKNLGGEVIYFGKPHKEVYLSCLKSDQKTLVIGDNLKTDIKGANNMNLDSIFITSGVHKSKTIDENLMDKLLAEHNVTANYFQKDLTW